MTALTLQQLADELADRFVQTICTEWNIEYNPNDRVVVPSSDSDFMKMYLAPENEETSVHPQMDISLGNGGWT